MKQRWMLTAVIFSFLIIPFGADCILDHAWAGGKPEKLVYGVIADMTGPYAASAGPSNAAFMDAIEYVNSNGGVRGVPIEPVVRDSTGRTEMGINMYMQMREMTPRPSMVMVGISSIAEALKQRFDEDQIPAYCVTSVPSIYPPGYIFGCMPLYASECALFMEWLSENWKEKRAPRLAFLTWDSSLGKAVLTDEVFNYAKSKGIEIVAKELFGLRDMDVTSQMMRIRSKKADWIYQNTVSHGPVAIAKAAQAMGYKVGIAGGDIFDDSMLYISRDIFEGCVGIHCLASWAEKDNPGIKLMNKYLIKNKRKPTYRSIMYPVGFSAILVFKEAVERVVDKHGWDKLNGATLKAEMEGLNNFDAGGIATFSYTKKRHAPNLARVFKIKGGQWRPISDFRACPDMAPKKFQ